LFQSRFKRIPIHPGGHFYHRVLLRFTIRESSVRNSSA
jgi:hypothetical protein